MRMTLDEYLSASPLTDEAFGLLINCSQSQVSRLRRRESAPSTMRIARIRDVTNGKVTFDDWFPLPEKTERVA